MLATANTYLQALATQARADAAEAQLASSQAIHQQAIDLRQNGIVAGLDVVRAEVQVSLRSAALHRRPPTMREKAKLQLARIDRPADRPGVHAGRRTSREVSDRPITLQAGAQ